ncbi:MAG: hypothetical protein KC501_21665 [Myxococcales bacterium]|nr:hypothetical protein [Myxococcales bacterium]
MSPAAESPDKGSRVKDLVITAAVASVVSALVAPWIRRLMGDGGGMLALPSAEPQRGAPAQAPDDFDERLERLLDVPEPITNDAMAAVSGRRRNSRRTIDVEANEAPRR